MLRFPIDMGVCRPWARTASAALMNGWINSIFIKSGPRARGLRHGNVVTQNVLDDFIQNFRLDWFLHKMASSALQGGNDVFLVADGRDHHDARFRMLSHDLFRRLDSFHLR